MRPRQVLWMWETMVSDDGLRSPSVTWSPKQSVRSESIVRRLTWLSSGLSLGQHAMRRDPVWNGCGRNGPDWYRSSSRLGCSA